MNQTWWRLGFVGMFVLSMFMLVGCGAEQRVTRVDTSVTTDLSGRWNDTDSKLVAEKMIDEMVNRPWLGNFYQIGQSSTCRDRRDHSE